MERLGQADVTSRESDVLALIGRRLSNAEIADELFISKRTVESHVSALLRKLGAGGRRELVDLAVELARKRDSRTPQFSSSFVGRTVDLAALGGRLRTNRLVTVVGPPGVGKTRLAVELAHGAPVVIGGPAWFVDLAPLPAATGRRRSPGRRRRAHRAAT